MSSSAAAADRPGLIYTRCRVCTCALGLDDDRTRGVCVDCANRPEGKRLLARAVAPGVTPTAAPSKTAAPTAPPIAVAAPPPAQERPFSPAEKSLIRHMHHVLPPADLLRVLNDRLQADVGPGVPLWTLEQVHAETTTLQRTSGASDWEGLRQIVRLARHGGVLDSITAEVINDFAMVFQLSSAQLMTLRDVIRSAKESA
jgi:hypothetical protein